MAGGNFCRSGKQAPARPSPIKRVALSAHAKAATEPVLARGANDGSGYAAFFASPAMAAALDCNAGVRSRDRECLIAHPERRSLGAGNQPWSLHEGGISVDTPYPAQSCPTLRALVRRTSSPALLYLTDWARGNVQLPSRISSLG